MSNKNMENKEKKRRWLIILLCVGIVVCLAAVSYTHLTLPTNREV